MVKSFRFSRLKQGYLGNTKNEGKNMFKIKIKALLYSVVISVFTLTLFYVHSTPVLYRFNDTVTVYTVSKSSTAEISKIKSPNAKFNVKGESCTVNKTVEELLKELDVTISHVESVNGITSYYGYTKKFKYETVAFNSKINVHIADNGKSVTVGTPIIFGAY